MTDKEYRKQFSEHGLITFQINAKGEWYEITTPSTDSIDKIINKYQNHNDDCIWSHRGLECEDREKLMNLCKPIIEIYERQKSPHKINKWYISWITTKGCQWEMDFTM